MVSNHFTKNLLYEVEDILKLTFVCNHTCIYNQKYSDSLKWEDYFSYIYIILRRWELPKQCDDVRGRISLTVMQQFSDWNSECQLKETSVNLLTKYSVFCFSWLLLSVCVVFKCFFCMFVCLFVFLFVDVFVC